MPNRGREIEEFEMDEKDVLCKGIVIVLCSGIVIIGCLPGQDVRS